MPSTPNLFPRFAEAIRSLSATSILDPVSVPELRLDGGQIAHRAVDMVYAPFDFVNTSARLVVVGLTPGKQQAANALRAAKEAIQAGATTEEASRTAKLFASFSGPMRANLIAMLDYVGVARWLGLQTTATLWTDDAYLVHFTSALRYPVFVDGANWSGTPDMLREPLLRKWLEQYTGSELTELRDPLFVPLGPKVAAALIHLAELGNIRRDRILDGMPHPSGANAERIAYFLGKKSTANLSSKTNPDPIDRAREELLSRVAAL